LATLKGAELTTTAKRRSCDAPKLIHLVKGDLDWIIMKCLEKDRVRRYETANGLAADLQRHLQNEPIIARPPSNAYRFQKMVRRNKLAFVAGTAVGAAVLAGLAMSTYLFIQERRAHSRALAAEHEQSQLRTKAEAESNKAKSEAERAEAAAAEVKMTLAASDFSLAVRLIEENEKSDSLAYLTRSLTLNPTNEAVSTRLTTLLASQPWWVPLRVFKLSGGVTSARFSPDGKRVVTASGIGAAQVWDAQSGQPLTGPMKPNGTDISAAQFSPDGERILTASPDRTWRVWDAQSGQSLTEPLTQPLTGTLRSAQFSLDGGRILTVPLLGQTVEVFNTASGQPLGELKTSGVLSAQFSPDGKQIITVSPLAGARVWDAQSGQPLTEPLKQIGLVWSAQLSPDGKRIVTASMDGTARVWDAQHGLPLTDPLKHDGGIVSAQFSPDGKRIVTGSMDGTARMWDAQSGLLLTGPLKHSGFLTSAQFSPDGKRILTVSGDSLYLWVTVGGQALAESFETDAYSQFSPDGKRLLTALFVKAELTARVWDVQSGHPLGEPFKPRVTSLATVPAVQFSPDGKKVVTISDDNAARVWDAQSGQPLTQPLKHSGGVKSVQFSPDGTRVVTASWDHTARVWDALSSQPLTEPLKHNGPVNSAQFSPDGKRIVTASFDRTARVWDARSGLLLTGPLQHDNVVNSAQFSPDGNRIVTASLDSARVWDALSGQPLTEPLKHNGPVNSAQFSPDGKRIVTASADGTARVWDAQSGVPLTAPLKHKGTVFSAQFSSDGKRIATTSWDHTARVWDALTGQPLTDPLKHGNMVFTAQFSRDGRRIFTTSIGDAARVWDIAPSAAHLPDWLPQLAEVISGEGLNHQGMLEQTKLNRGDMLSQIRQRLTQAPDDDEWVQWGRWFLADPATRTISPFSKVTVPEYIENRIHDDTVASLAEAERLSVGNRDLSERVARAERTVEQRHRFRMLRQDADALTAQGQLAEAGTNYAEALDISRKLNGPEHPDTIQAMKSLADSYSSLGRGTEAIALLEKACELDSNDTDASLTLATWQTWFGQDAAYEATRRRLVQQAEGTDHAGTAERAAKAACLRNSSDTALLAKALNLAQQGVELGKSTSLLPWYQLSLGLAEYRNGQYPAAERSLTIAEQTVGEHPDIQGIARLFRAMSLFRQARPEEAQKLFSQAEAQMPPRPQDERKPQLDGKPVSHDVLIWWLAYKEANSLLNETTTAKP
jgi:WD40 repeat protein